MSHRSRVNCQGVSRVKLSLKRFALQGALQLHLRVPRQTVQLWVLGAPPPGTKNETGHVKPPLTPYKNLSRLFLHQKVLLFIFSEAIFEDPPKIPFKTNIKSSHKAIFNF